MADTKEFFDTYLPNKVKTNPDLGKSVNAVFQFDIKDAGTWTLDLKNENSVTEGPATNPDCVITTDKATWEKILDNPGQAVSSVMMGRLKVSNLGLATQLQKILA